MPKYIVTEVVRYEVEASNEREALNNYHILFEDIEPEMFGLTKATLEQDSFEFLDGSLTASEAETLKETN